MSAASALRPSVEPHRRPFALWLWALVCASVAFGPIALTLFLRHRGFVPPETSLFDEYLGYGGLLYFGSAASCAVLLVLHHRHAVSAALILVACVAFMLVRASWGWLHGSIELQWAVARAVHLVLFAALLAFTIRLRSRGLLR